jgi:nucleoside 2-deoxyribosyltransferase
MKAIAQTKNTSFTTLDSRSGFEMNKNPLTLSVSICGSYHRHLRKMHRLIQECKKLGIEVHIPRYPVRKSSINGFVFLKGEKGTPKQLQEKNFDAIAHSSFVLVVNTNGYIGSSTAMEIGYAIARDIPIFCTDKPEDYVFQLYTQYGKTLPEIVEILTKS